MPEVFRLTFSFGRPTTGDVALSVQQCQAAEDFVQVAVQRLDR
jgi:hypothetical protein